MRSWFYQWYQGYTNIVQGSTIGTNGNANGTIGTLGKPMVPLATDGTIGKFTNDTIERTPNRACVIENPGHFGPVSFYL